jgi:CRP/FNR family cyclic AMP-dependent transcriptional regulator
MLIMEQAMTKVNYLKHQKEMISFEAGQIVFKEGDTGDFMYGVIEGEVEISYRGHVLDVVGEGGVVGEMALVGDHTRSATVIAKTDCKLAPVNHQHFLWLVHETPTFATQVMAVMAERIRHLHEMLD